MNTAKHAFYSYFTQDLNEYFTKDAWKQFVVYLTTLNEELHEYKIPEGLIQNTFTGIEEYVLGYYQELGNDVKVTFKQVLNLIEEIGTPSEIVEDLYVVPDITEVSEMTQTHEYTRHCSDCGVRLGKDIIYCNNCGRNTRVASREFSPRKQWMIDHPYTAGVVFAFGSAVLLGIIGAILIVISVMNEVEVTIKADFGFIVLMGLFIMGIGMIIGWYLDSTYRDYVSFHQRYERLKDEFNNARFGGHFTVVITIVVYIIGGIMHRNALLNTSDGNPTTVIIVLLLPIYLLLTMTGEGPDVQELPYYQLLVLKQKVDRRLMSNFINFNKIIFMPIIIATLLWHFLIYEPLALTSAYFAIPGYVMAIFLLVISNALFYSYQYSWSRVVKIDTD